MTSQGHNTSQALDIRTSCWVSASAGSGKTKILIDRVLSLLLSGVKPRKILCLTFTKAAASEMMQRIMNRLSSWSQLDNETLKQELKIFSPHINEAYIQTARSLFHKILDLPQGLRIQTLHAFSESLLHRFPLEAKLDPHFKVIDEQQSLQLIKKIIQKGLNALTLKQESSLRQKAYVWAIHYLSSHEIFDILKGLIVDHQQLAHFHNEDLLLQHVEKSFQDYGWTLDKQEKDLFDSMLGTYDNPPPEGFLAFLEKEAYEQYEMIKNWHCDKNNRSFLFKTYKTVFLTLQDEPRSRVFKKKVLEFFPDLNSWVILESEKLVHYLNQKNQLIQLQVSNSLLVIGNFLGQLYQDSKQRLSGLDFDDLILKTRGLLEHQSDSTWILYKLDQELEHILVDEAQDTNANQWRIITGLCQEFFVGEGRTVAPRSLFVVGDRKQSIYSFQQASPFLFDSMQAFFKELVESSGNRWADLFLTHSYRSLPAVLKSVDSILSHPLAKLGVSQDLKHIPTRLQNKGYVEIWPLKTQENTNFIEENWALPYPSKPVKLPRIQMVESVAEHIQSLLQNKTYLESENRPLRPSDILILVRNRGKLMGDMVAALKNRLIPVLGIDRLILTEALVVEDLLAVMEFVLLPADDLKLAIVLKSPFFNFTDEDLLEFAPLRENNLWEALQKYAKDQGKFQESVNQLQGWIEAAKNHRPYDFLMKILIENKGRQKLLSRLGLEASEWLDELLQLALRFEKNYIPHLQFFVDFMTSNSLELKRDLTDASQNAVRIMTIHGSKGLEAPFVYLIDTVHTLKIKNSILYDHLGNPHVKRFKAKSKQNLKAFDKAYETQECLEQEEYNRLLYVALTRARDHLILTGYHKDANYPETCWYHFASLASPQSLKEPETQVIGKDHNKMPADHPQNLIPNWLETKIIDHQDTHFRPSTLRGTQGKHHYEYAYGILVHKLLFEGAKEKSKLTLSYASSLPIALTLKPHEIQMALDEAISVLKAPQFQNLFNAKKSLGEVPVQGLLEGKMFSGVIDRLIIQEKSIVLIDFKTDLTPPEDFKKVPENYLVQMGCYQKLLEQMYKGYDFKIALLWTKNLSLMELSESLCNQAFRESLASTERIRFLMS
jgi:ATP-dependent helicase/nuclease subunit A